MSLSHHCRESLSNYLYSIARSCFSFHFIEVSRQLYMHSSLKVPDLDWVIACWFFFSHPVVDLLLSLELLSCCTIQSQPSFSCCTGGLTFDSGILCYTEKFMVDSIAGRPKQAQIIIPPPPCLTADMKCLCCLPNGLLCITQIQDCKSKPFFHIPFGKKWLSLDNPSKIVLTWFLTFNILTKAENCSWALFTLWVLYYLAWGTLCDVNSRKDWAMALTHVWVFQFVSHLRLYEPNWVRIRLFFIMFWHVKP